MRFVGSAYCNEVRGLSILPVHALSGMHFCLPAISADGKNNHSATGESQVTATTTVLPPPPPTTTSTPVGDVTVTRARGAESCH